MSNAMDRFKLIAEIRKRPVLWDFKSEENRSRKTVRAAWNNVAVAMGSDVDDCSRTWKSLRSTNREVVKKLELEKNKYKCQWIFYKHMKFINDIKKSSPMELNDNKSDDNDSNQDSKSHNMDTNNKMDENDSLDEQEMPNIKHKRKLIAEIRKRPALWDFKSKEHRTCLSLAEVWKDVAVSMESDVQTCQHKWKNLFRYYKQTVRRLELRIKENKLKGTYDPNNDYNIRWPYYEDMEFMKVKICTPSDRLKLIAEIRKRPALWGFQNDKYYCRVAVQKLWKDVADILGLEVADCKRKWSYLRNVYRLEAKQLELRIKEDKLNGLYDPNNDYSSKLDFFQPMKFIEDIKMSRPTRSHNSSSNDNYNEKVSEVRIVDNIRLECDDDMDTEMYVYNEVDNDDDDDTVSQIYSEQEAENIQLATNTSGPNLPENQEPTVGKPTSTLGKCTKRSYNQANFLQDIENEQQYSIKSARLDTTRSNDMVHVGNSNHNFLVSFLSKMKKMNEVQNMQFRAKMTDIMLTILSQSNNAV